jgi:hypothetical protein
VKAFIISFIRKAIQYEWGKLDDTLEAGYYDIIEEFCNISRRKKIFKDLFEWEGKS